MKHTTKAIVIIFMSIFMIVVISGCKGDGVNGAYSPHNLLDEGIPEEPTENIAPTANAGADQTIIEGETAVLTCEGSDEDGEVISYSWLQGGTEVSTTQEYTTPTSLTAGTYTYTCEVTDADGATASDDVMVTVNEATVDNTRPVADSQSASILCSSTVPENIVLNGTDADDDALTYRIVKQPTHGTVELSGNTASYMINDNADDINAMCEGSEVDSFQFVVNDGLVDSEPATVEVAVNFPT